TVTFGYGEVGFSFDVTFAAGKITAVMGPSGSGKSTLLNLVAGFETPASGRVRIGGKDVTEAPPAARPVSMVFQENNLFAHLTVEQNVGLGRSPSLRLSTGDRADIAAALGRTGLAGKEGRLPRELSGGERQRVALSRVLVRRQPVLLLDEPFASLGPSLRTDMLALLCARHAAQGTAARCVNHPPPGDERVADDVVLLEPGRVAVAAPTSKRFDGPGPQAFQRYIGAASEGSQDVARKRT